MRSFLQTRHRHKTFRWVCLVVLAAASLAPGILENLQANPAEAVHASRFLDSLGVNSSISRRGEQLEETVRATRYLGIRWFRCGYEGDLPVDDLLSLHAQTGVRFSYGLLSGGNNLDKLLQGGRRLAKAGALLALEGPNEPNNWQVEYQGERGGGSASWLPVAKLQRDLYQAVQADPVLKAYPVWALTETGAQTDNTGLQFLRIPTGSQTLMPAGTVYADHANCHNYVTHPGWPGLHDNQSWNAADPTSACRVDGLFGNYGRTWREHFTGYSGPSLMTLPRVTTETGVKIEGEVTEEIQARLFLCLFLSQFKRGWDHTAVYLLRDRVDESGNQSFGFYRPDYTPRLGAVYLHRLTQILQSNLEDAAPTPLDYGLQSETDTVHHLLLTKGPNTSTLVVWNERFKGGSDQVIITLPPKVASAALFNPRHGTDPTATYADAREVSLILGNEVVILELHTRLQPQ